MTDIDRLLEKHFKQQRKSLIAAHLGFLSVICGAIVSLVFLCQTEEPVYLILLLVNGYMISRIHSELSMLRQLHQQEKKFLSDNQKQSKAYF